MEAPKQSAIIEHVDKGKVDGWMAWSGGIHRSAVDRDSMSVSISVMQDKNVLHRNQVDHLAWRSPGDTEHCTEMD